VDSVVSYASTAELADHETYWSSRSAEQRIAAGADEACGNDQNDTEDDLTLDQLDDSDDNKYRSDHPEKGSLHVTLLSLKEIYPVTFSAKRKLL
jgi:hypothetical protein